MRMITPGARLPRAQRLATIALRLLAVLLICSVATPSAAGGLGPLLPHLGVSATALSLLLATAASKPRD